VLGRLLLGRAFNLLELRLMTTLPVAPPLAQPISAAEFMATAPPAMDGSSPWAQRYAAEIRRAWYAEAEQAPRTLQQHLGPSELGVECFSGDTEVVTRNGIRRIDALAVEGSAELLVPMLYEGSDVRKKWGQFVRVPVVYLGDQHTYTLTLRRGKERKVVRTTAGHRWFRSFYSGKRKAQEVVVTRELLAGHRLTQLRRAMPRSSSLMPWAVAQGFVFGDGTSGSNDARHRPAACDRQVVGKMAALPTTNHVSDPWPSIVGTACHAWAEGAFTADNLRGGVMRWLAEQKVTPHPDHPGTADLYDAVEQAVVDHKFLGESSMAKVRKDPPRKYKRQLLLYGLGYYRLGLPVRRVAIAAYPRTAASLDGLYVWDQGFSDEAGQILPEVLAELEDTFAETTRRRGLADQLLAQQIRLDDVTALPDGDECCVPTGFAMSVASASTARRPRRPSGTAAPSSR
jgi:hypothetical protein